MTLVNMKEAGTITSKSIDMHIFMYAYKQDLILKDHQSE